MDEILLEHIARRLKTIQKKYNFNPLVGVKQIAKSPEQSQVYGRFRELVDQIKKLNLPIKVPYDPIGCGGGQPVSVKPETKLYLFQKIDGTSFTNIYKVGYSTKPNVRIGAIQTGNDGTLCVRAIFPGDSGLERLLKFKLRKYKTRDRNNFKKGEWFKLPPDIVQPIIKELRKIKQEETQKKGKKVHA